MNNNIDTQIKNLVHQDPYLEPHSKIIRRRLNKIAETETRLTQAKMTLADFASGHEFYGLHLKEDVWVFREWAPNATAVYLIGDMTGWEERDTFVLKRLNQDGDWELRLPFRFLNHGEHYRLSIHWRDGCGNRIPAYARRVVQDARTLIFNAQVWNPETPYQWTNHNPRPMHEPPIIYEAHVGMAQEEEKIGTYNEFSDRILPRIIKAGYNTLQLMALPEHPYYGSFGYQVANFFAASSRFGSPEELKALVDTAHGAGLRVIMDIIHSHSVSNEVEGLSRFDGTLYQYFHAGPRGRHPAWDSRCFDYGKLQVLHFLLSNCRFWMDEYRLDGFRFDGITSMLYQHHGLGRPFTHYDDYFNDDVDEDALTYLALANKVIHNLNPHAVTIAEDVSGMPGLAVSDEKGGFGFDYRFAMGIPDHWIKLTKDIKDEDWSMGHLWHELTNRRADEKTISYAESHDQALVGDQTLIFRLMGDAIYDHMRVADKHLLVERGMALHKMIRLLTLGTAGNGYMNFMGNEFGHPEWIDFPRRENNWSYRYARRQWHLVEDPELKYAQLACFDRHMIRLAGKYALFEHTPGLILEHTDDKIIAFSRGRLIFIFNFHADKSYTDYFIQLPPGRYRWVFDSDASPYGGLGRLDLAGEHVYHSPSPSADQSSGIRLYLPCRTAMVIRWYPPRQTAARERHRG